MEDTREGTVQRRRGPAEIQQIVAEFAQSGLRRTEFCRRHGLTLGTLHRYLKRLHEESEKIAASGGLVAVELMDPKVGTSPKSGAGLAVVLPQGRRIEVGTGFDPTTLQRLVSLLEKM